MVLFSVNHTNILNSGIIANSPRQEYSQRPDSFNHPGSRTSRQTIQATGDHMDRQLHAERPVALQATGDHIDRQLHAERPVALQATTAPPLQVAEEAFIL